MNHYPTVLFLILLAILTSCGDKKEATQVSSDPCEIINLAFINANLSPETEVKHRASAGRFPSCSYKWEVADSQERKNAYTEQ